ncbi:MAG: serine--tRNA ligase [Candidatus Moranbacteria bacterium]|nr:serine--tRNA ligase [Candidatus Moranbacteria bacterium]OIQ04199.1 MAG: serine--tRNA ligase [Candidatus Moranbacteria bacterium CG2_30_41_165]PJC00398.1 MAG: serine--tRNA ligase [Candidatus Moranbacteria bacterium CG_4_9_14_0_8_um_filter_41_43]HCJ45449.1 serine--tRNA ligase [Candidatus Moranbacteria bacterium]
MLDIQFIRENKEHIAEAIKNKNSTLDLELLLGKDVERRALLQEIEELKSLKNDINDLIHQAKTDEERAEIIAKGKEIKLKLDEKEPFFENIEYEYLALMAQVPNIVSPDTPIGTSDEQNVEVARIGTLPTFAFTPRTHIELGKMLDILDLERGTKVSGYRGYYLKNEGTLIVMGLMMYAIQKLVSKGYTPMIPPTLVKNFPLFGSGYFKGMEYDGGIDEVYQVATSDKEADGSLAKEEKFLVGTAEPSLLAYYAGEVLEEKDLPLKLAGYSQCYRSEIGSYGKDTKGMYRVHEFMKVEQVVLATADTASVDALQDEMLAISEEMHRELGLPYRKLQICTGDMSAGKYRAFDLEAWMPGMNRYGETGSASSFLDWQSRRLNVKYKDAKTGERKYVYMLNNTALPSPRIFIALLENYQQVDGSVIVPEVLRPFVGKEKIEVK